MRYAVNSMARFVVIDNSSPTITAIANDTIVNCIDSATGNLTELQSWLDNNGGATATDGCSSGASAFTWTNNYDGLGIPQLVACTNDTTAILDVIFTATDDCDNAITTSARFIVIDTSSPTITAMASDTIVNCIDSAIRVILRSCNHG